MSTLWIVMRVLRFRNEWNVWGEMQVSECLACSSGRVKEPTSMMTVLSPLSGGLQRPNPFRRRPIIGQIRVDTTSSTHASTPFFSGERNRSFARRVLNEWTSQDSRVSGELNRRLLLFWATDSGPAEGGLSVA